VLELERAVSGDDARADAAAAVLEKMAEGRDQLIWLSVDIPLAQATFDAVEENVFRKGM
jgi:hypothetical protein